MNKKIIFVAMGMISVILGCNKSNAQSMDESKNFHDLSALTIDGDVFDFSILKGKRVLIVNTASACGFTPQLTSLQKLWDQSDHQDFLIMGFPCNDFGSQESGTLEEIESFCSKNYGVTFQLMEKVKIKTSPVYEWLMNKSQNGVRNAKVLWNFHKFLVDENGLWSGSFLPTTSPNSSSIKDFALGA